MYGMPLKLTFAANSNSDLYLLFFTCMCTCVSISYKHARRVVHGSVLMPCHVPFDLPLMKALDWAEMSGNCVTINICPSISLASEVLNP